MQFSLNGERQTLDENTSLQQLLASLGYENKRLAVEINGNIIPKSEHATYIIQANDQIEVVHAIGGGQFIYMTAP